MLRHRIYYRLKPFVPRSIRLGIRRWFATRKLKEVRDIWPIVPASERRPADWLGWPDGKQFALVLTHDVEGKAGLRKCRELMRLEQDLGFCSSFNFIPEGDYKVPPDLRDELESNGFEVGIHDLRHDGRLFLSRREFSRRLRGLTAISGTGMRQDLDRASCSTSWTGFTSSIFCMMLPLSIPTHSSRSQKGAIRSFPSG